MPNIPSTGAAGQIPFTGKPPAGKQEHGDPSPSHGAAGGYDVPFTTHGASAQVRPEGAGKTGLKDAALGG
jgi:hypothetical protein